MKRLLFLLPLLAIGAHAAPVSLFDGKTLDGWDYDPAIWRVEDGMITGGSTTEKIKANYFICTKRSFQNFELRMRIKCSGDPATGLINSGIQIRSLRVPGGAHMSGYQVDCGKGWFGKIYDEFRRNKVIAEPLDAAALDKAVDVFGWNEYRIRAEGPRIQVWINGVAAIDYTEQDKNIALDGQIGPQVHSGGVTLVQVKDVTIEELLATPGAPTWESLGGVEAARAKVAPAKKGAAAPTKPMKPGNAAQGAPKSAQEQQKLFHLPEGFEIELVVQESDGIGKFVSVYFDQRGRMWTQTAFEYPVDGNENPAAAEALYKSKGKDKVLVYPRESLNAAIPAGGLTNPTVFTDGLAIPLGILPWGNGDTCYVQHGHDLKLFKDTNGDGRADTSDVILTGFGVQDSHLFPHQFTRAPGGWIWMAQGLFNNSKVRKPDGEAGVDWPKCSMAKTRPDGSGFEVTSTGPNNIWGLVITGEGEAFIQEANDYGYPVMPFHEYAYCPGGMEPLKRSYQPDFPPQAEFRMGGTGLSGLALGEGAFRKVVSTLVEPNHAASALPGSTKVEATLVMFVANPITSKVQTLAMHRDGPYWKLEQAADLVTCDDPFFRPVALTNGPDGCIYIVDWYNKIISHNEVPRTHPDRDKTRGRIWRVKPKGAKPEVADFTKLSGEQLTAALKDGPIGKSHLAWQTLADRKQLPANHWAASDYAYPRESNRLRQIGRTLNDQNIGELLAFAKPSLPDGPKTQSSRGAKQLPAREAYDREFERFLVRMFLERHPDLAAKFLDTDDAKKLPVEARLLASLSLEPLARAPRVAKFLPQLQRAPGQEEILRLAQFPEEPGVGEAQRAILSDPKTGEASLESLLAVKTRVDAKKLAPFLADAAQQLLAAKDERAVQLGIQLAEAFRLASTEGALTGVTRTLLSANPSPEQPRTGVSALRALASLGSNQTELFAKLAESSPDALLRDEALAALASSKAADAPARALALYPKLAPSQRRTVLERLSATKPGVGAILAALNDSKLAASDLDASILDRLQAVLGANDPALTKLTDTLGALFRPVLA
ncbi:MAG: family 16 glycoside hydrolase, partial [Chthoniobacteraceae bacterium]